MTVRCNNSRCPRKLTTQQNTHFILHFCHTCSLCHVELVVKFPARGSTQVLLCLFPGVLWLRPFLYSVGPRPVSSPHIYTLSLCRGHSWRVRLAKQETLTPPGHLVSPLVCKGPWMSNVVLYCWCHSDSASVLLYFTFTLFFAIPSKILVVYRISKLRKKYLCSCVRFRHTWASFKNFFILDIYKKNRNDIRYWNRKKCCWYIGYTPKSFCFYGSSDS